ncbi:MAG TPA: SIMPL domain-containing protein [Gemmatimonadales bacterium]|jgi:hypothetical protein|nr:SIMPL domain-containing protein [Gemmatimonadales bacterium]
MLNPVTASLAALLLAQAPAPAPKGPVIFTAGSGEATLTPQRAVLHIGMTSRASNAAEASSRNAKTLRSVLDTLVRAGFPRESLKTVDFGVGPNIDYEHANKITGYDANATIRLVVRDLTQVGRVIDLALTAGANDVPNVEFESDSLEIGRRRALREALAKARSDADALATAAGGSLGRLLDVSTVGGFGFAPGARLSAVALTASASRAPAFTPRDVVVPVSVQARWEFVPGPR